MAWSEQKAGICRTRTLLSHESCLGGWGRVAISSFRIYVLSETLL